jgi:hypothetical protein
LFPNLARQAFYIPNVRTAQGVEVLRKACPGFPCNGVAEGSLLGHGKLLSGSVCQQFYNKK